MKCCAFNVAIAVVPWPKPKFVIKCQSELKISIKRCKSAGFAFTAETALTKPHPKTLLHKKKVGGKKPF